MYKTYKWICRWWWRRLVHDWIFIILMLYVYFSKGNGLNLLGGRRFVCFPCRGQHLLFQESRGTSHCPWVRTLNSRRRAYVNITLNTEIKTLTNEPSLKGCLNMTILMQQALQFVSILNKLFTLKRFTLVKIIKKRRGDSMIICRYW